MTTQSNCDMLAANLADARPGSTFTGLIKTLKGQERGRGADKKLYGNDQVHVTVVTGFDYKSLNRRSLERLATVTDQEILDSAAKKGIDLTADDVAAARTELEESLKLSEAGENTSTTDDVYEPLVVDGETVKSGRVYRCKRISGIDGVCHCRACTGDERASLNGTIYLKGLKVNETVLTAAPNGPIPAAKSAPKTVAKNMLRSRLPISHYVAYALEPGTEFFLAVGGAAVRAASANGMDFAKVGELIALCG